MTYRYHGRADVNPVSPRSFGICDRCSFLYNLEDLHWQKQFAGVGVVNLEILVCRTCLDVMQPQLQTLILPPDPAPVFNARPEYYALDETGPVVDTATLISSPSGSVDVFYVDIFDGDPLSQGVSVLEVLTGSATRTDFASSMTVPSGGLSMNSVDIVITPSSQGTVNVSYIGIYDAASGGSLLMSAPLVNTDAIVLYNGLQFPAGALQVNLN